MKQTVDTAIILAAGTGNRLYPLTEEQPKPLTVVGGTPIIHRMINNLIEIGITKIVVVTGHLGDLLKAELENEFSAADIAFEFIHNAEYRTTNNIFSLWLAREYFLNDFLLLESDVVCDVDVLRDLVDRPQGSSACLVSPKAFYMDGACVEITGYPLKVTAPKQIKAGQTGPEHYKTVNFYRISSGFASGWLVRHLADSVRKGELSVYYEAAFSTAINEGIEDFSAAIVSRDRWFEVDNLNDLDIAEFTFMSAAQREKHLRDRHGGYWRYPITDHCLLYNFHYPPKKLMDHLCDRIEMLVREYPSAQQPITRYLAQYYAVPETVVAVANGVSEFIPIVLNGVDRPVVIPTPSFNEYEAVVPQGALVRAPLHEGTCFRVEPEVILSAAAKSGAGHIILISPNNPTGAAIPRPDIEKILIGAAELGCKVILDESFVDFQAGSRNNSFLTRLSEFPNLIILFSLSKSHGISGIRIGMMASSNQTVMDRARARLPIWNINAFAEEYLRMFSAFREEYMASCIAVRSETDKLQEELAKIVGLRVYNSDANFVFCRLDEGMPTAQVLTSELLDKYSIFIKECSGKTMPKADRFFRVASRMPRENARVVRAIRDLLNTQTDGLTVVEDSDAPTI